MGPFRPGRADDGRTKDWREGLDQVPVAPVYSGEARQDLDFLFVHHKQVDVVEQPVNLPGGGGGVEDDEGPAVFRGPRGLPDQRRRDLQLQHQDVAGLHGGEPRFDIGGGKPRVCARTDDDLVFALVVDRDDGRPRGGGAADPHMTGVDVGLGQDLKDPPSMGVVTDRAGEFHRRAGAGRRDGLVAALAAGAECCVRSRDGFASPGQGMDADGLVDVEASDHKNRAHWTCSFGGVGWRPKPQIRGVGREAAAVTAAPDWCPECPMKRGRSARSEGRLIPVFARR